MMPKQLLIVDDDPDLLFLVAHAIKSLSPNYQVSTAEDGRSALEQMQKKKFDLVVTDYMMPGITGLEVIKASYTFSPETLFILMTAHHDTNHVRDSISELDLHGFVTKPFTMPDLLDVVKQTLNKQESYSTKEKEQEAKVSTAIQEQVRTLHQQVGAHSVLLVNSDGMPVCSSGHIERTKAARLARFVSSNFLSITELANLFGDNESTFTSSYYQGSKYNIYAYDINGNYFLAVVFGVGGKPGAAWFYTKQAAKALAALLPKTKINHIQRDTSEVAEDFDNLLKI